MNNIPATIRDALHQNQDIEDEDGHKFGNCRLCWVVRHISTRTLGERLRMTKWRSKIDEVTR